MSRNNFSFKHLWPLLGVSLFILLAGCSPTLQEFQPIKSDDPPSASTPASYANGTIQVWFTDPEGNRSGEEPLDAILSAIDSAHGSIDVAIYSFSQPEIANALIRARARGVKVRMVMESDNMGKDVPRKLSSAGIPIIGDGQDGLMHNKFMVIDGTSLLMGSTNYTNSGLKEDNNFLLRIDNQAIAGAYAGEFERMFTQKEFGELNQSPSPQTHFKVGSDSVDVYFSPEDHISDRLVDLVEGSDQSIHFLAYTFTLNDLGTAVLKRARKGVSVEGVFEGDILPGSTGSEYDFLRRGGLNIRLDGNSGLMHEKLFLLDGNTVILGSYNFTRSADEENDENLMVIHDAELAKIFESEFQNVFSSSKP